MSSLKLPRLTSAVAVADPNTGKGAAIFGRFWDKFATQIEGTVNGLSSAVAAIAAAQAAAAAANTAAAAANTAATTAQTAATAAQTTANQVTSSASLNNSYTTGLTLTAADAGTNATVSISAHTRIYGDGTSFSVSSGSITALSYSTNYWVYYDDPARAGGTETYIATTTYATAFPTTTYPDRHFVGAVTTPAHSGPMQTGNGAKPANYVTP